MKSNKKDMVIISIFLGSLWGILEATLGYFFHVVSQFTIPGIAGFFMFPLGFFIMRIAFRETSRLESILYTASVAALVKLTDLFIPLLPPQNTINPAISIMLEAMAVLIFWRIYNPVSKGFPLFEGIVLSISWRALFIVYLILIPFSFGIVERGLMPVMRFLFLDGVINGFLIALILHFEKEKVGKILIRIPATKPVISLLLFLLAVTLEAVI